MKPRVPPMPIRHRDDAGQTLLQIARRHERTTVLGPGEWRAAVMVQGCEQRCTGCIVPESHARSGGEQMSREQLAAWLIDLDPPGVTFSGGEPFLQAAALGDVIDIVRAASPGISVMSYTGYRLEMLRQRGTSTQRALLERLDVLIDGPYVRRLHADLRWRGSSNQRIHALTDRHAEEIAAIDDQSAGLEITFEFDGGVAWMGVPAQPGFRAEWDEGIAGAQRALHTLPDEPVKQA